MPPDEPPQPVLPYRSPGATRHLDAGRAAMIVVVGAIAIIAFNAVFAVKAWRDWHAAQRVVHSRDPARRIVKTIQRGRPAVFPSKTALALLIGECAWSVAWASYLLRAGLRRWHDPACRSWKSAVMRFSHAKLWTSWIGVVAALYLGVNLRAVHDEFELLGDWPHFSYATYSTLTIVAVIASSVFVHFVLLPPVRSVEQSRAKPR